VKLVHPVREWRSTLRGLQDVSNAYQERKDPTATLALLDQEDPMERADPQAELPALATTDLQAHPVPQDPVEITADPVNRVNLDSTPKLASKVSTASTVFLAAPAILVLLVLRERTVILVTPAHRDHPVHPAGQVATEIMVPLAHEEPLAALDKTPNIASARGNRQERSHWLISLVDAPFFIIYLFHCTKTNLSYVFNWVHL